MGRATSLTNPVSGTNVTDRFNAIVMPTVTSGINYGTNAKPFPEAPNSFFGGSTSPGTGLDFSNTLSGEINAADLISVMETLTGTVTNIRSANFKLNLTSSGSAPYNVSAGPRTGSPGIIENVTGKSYLSTSYRQTISISSGPASEDLITRNSIQTDVLSACRDAYAVAASNTAIMPTVNVCHASCHSSCHNSRSRR